jgi:acyl dehydratase
MGVLEDLQARVGQEEGPGEWMEITQDRINEFADATDDHQWIHVDEERAKAGPFGKTIAHGFLTLSLVPALTQGIPTAPIEGVKMGINYGLDRVRFINPVPVGAKVRARRKLVEVKEVTGGVQMKNEVTVEIDGEEKPACVAETIARLYF